MPVQMQDKVQDKIKKPVNPSYNKDCAACVANLLHSLDQKALYHPLSGHGFSPETKWTHDLLRQEAELNEAKRLEAMKQVNQ